ncbi:MAG TPA: beta-N-acetylhexosaminidase [Symbiobacteriaceae bacterium]|nr:beta-N-acetylhexosaminidase [Symbiobacteriaceae bacterium]
MTDPRTLVQAMTLEEKAAQMLFLGFKETELPERVGAFVEKHGLGGIILFTRNVKTREQTLALTTAAQQAAKRSRQGLPLAISIDQEGGTVTRMGEDAGYTHFPGNMALGAANDPSLTYRAARTMAAEMRAVGVNWNYAPVLDVNNNADNPVIGVRSYGASPELVAKHGCAAIKGYQDGHVAACGKHFPGHGDTATDSHLALPVIPHDRARLEAVEFAPFREAIKAGLDSMMTAHVFFPALESTPGLPATLSKNVITGLLRKEMGFDGVISTDCLEMKAIADNFTPEQTVQLAVDAGVDALLVSHTWDLQVAMYEALLKLVREGKISEERVAESALRVVRMKLARKMEEFLPADIGSQEHADVALEVARKAVTVAWGAEHLPLKGKVTLVLPRVIWFSQVEDSRDVLAKLIQGLKDAGLTVDAIDCKLNMEGVDAEELIQRAGPGGTVIFGAVGVGRNPQQAEVAQRLVEAGCKVVAVARRMPYDLKHFPGAIAGLAAYDESPAMQVAVVEALTGKLQATGKMPV